MPGHWVLARSESAGYIVWSIKFAEQIVIRILNNDVSLIKLLSDLLESFFRGWHHSIIFNTGNLEKRILFPEWFFHSLIPF